MLYRLSTQVDPRRTGYTTTANDTRGRRGRQKTHQSSRKTHQSSRKKHQSSKRGAGSQGHPSRSTHRPDPHLSHWEVRLTDEAPSPLRMCRSWIDAPSEPATAGTSSGLQANPSPSRNWSTASDRLTRPATGFKALSTASSLFCVVKYGEKAIIFCRGQ